MWKLKLKIKISLASENYTKTFAYGVLALPPSLEQWERQYMTTHSMATLGISSSSSSARADAWCTSGARAVCAFLTAAGSCSCTKQTISRLQEKDTVSAVSPYSNISVVFFYLLTVSLGFFFCCPNWVCSPKLQTRKCLKHPCEGNPALFPQADPHMWFHFPPVQEDLRAEVQGGGRGRAVLRTHQCLGEPEANRKGTRGGCAIQREHWGGLPSPGTGEYN